MSDNTVYQEIFDNHQIFFENYIKQFSPYEKAEKFSKERLSYINYLTDVKYIKIIIPFFNIVSR